MRNRRAFTLIELLVVIGIIATLTSLLLPELMSAKAFAQKVVCRQNLHGVVVGNVSYAEYYNDHYALAAEDMTSGNLKRWFGEREDENSPFLSGGAFASFLPAGFVKPCPSFKEFVDTAGQESAFEAGCGGYGYNELYIGGRFNLYKTVRDNTDNSKRGYANSARTASVVAPSQTVMFADTAYKMPDGELMAYSFTHAPKWIPSPPYGGGRPNPPIHFRHEGMANVGWADGHATSERMTFSSGYTTHGEISAEEAEIIGLGWFGEYYEKLPEANYLFDTD